MARSQRGVEGATTAVDAAYQPALCHLDSSATWVTMRRELGMDGRDIATPCGPWRRNSNRSATGPPARPSQFTTNGPTRGSHNT